MTEEIKISRHEGEFVSVHFPELCFPKEQADEYFHIINEFQSLLFKLLSYKQFNDELYVKQECYSIGEVYTKPESFKFVYENCLARYDSIKNPLTVEKCNSIYSGDITDKIKVFINNEKGIEEKE